MRIATVLGVLSRGNGGVSEVARRLSQEVAARPGHEVEAFGLDDEFWPADRGGWAPLTPHASWPLPPRSFGFAPGLTKSLAQLRPDVLHVHGLWIYPGLAARLAQGRTAARPPRVVTVHGMLDAWALANSAWKKRIAAGLFERRNLADASCIHAITSAERDSIRAYGIRAPICVIPNGVDLPAETSPIAMPAPWAEAARGRKVLLYLGRIHPKKGLLPLLEALASARAFREEWMLAIAGWDQGGFTETLRRRATELGLTGDVAFVGPQFGEAKSAAYRHAQAFVLPSFSEGLPLVVLEAWAHGLPVLMTPACGLPVGFERRAALPADPDPDSLAEGLRLLGVLPAAELREMGARGRALVAESYAWPAIATEVERLYRWLLGQADPPPGIT